jgi:diguanylate cyclase (GGDEF)-like protein
MKILLVEDMRTVAAIMAARLTSFGYEVSIAENGQIGFDKFCEFSPDLVLMDIEMPVINGFQATNLIRAFETTQKWAWTPIIFLTASDTQDNLITAIEAGGDDFLTKGIAEEVLHAKMKAMVRIADMRRQLSIANQKLEQQASRDGLTGLFNRRWMDHNVDRLWAQAKLQGSSFAILMMDVDNFKKYNDRYGHQTGDDCLRGVANAVDAVVNEMNASGLTKNAFAARYGGEEFAVIIPEATAVGYEQCGSACVKSIRNLSIRHEQNGEWGIVTVSVGGCRKEVSSGDVVKIFRDADAALYLAKNRGRNRMELVT